MDEDFETQTLDSTLQSPSETLLSIRLLDFKTSLLEAIEELRIRREMEINYEDQISKIVVEKQELEWQKVTFLPGSSGKYQLAVETKEKEIDGLKEALKALQISKYTLQKKLNEMDQKLQMHLAAKEEHHKKLNEVEKCYATIACQFGIIKGVHGKLEFVFVLNCNAYTDELFICVSCVKELKKVTTDLVRSKVTSQYRVAEENINLAAKEKQFQELQQKIRMVFWNLNKIFFFFGEYFLFFLKQTSWSLQCVQDVLQRITQTNVRMESELNALKEDYKTLERDNELQREKAKENEEKFLNLQNEHEKALRTWKKDVENTLTLTDLQVLENSFKDEINVASPHEEKQREASPRNTLCTDTDLITQGQTLEIHVTEHKEEENLRATCRMFLDENSAHLEQKLQDSTEPAAACCMQTRKVILDSADAVGACRENGSQETDSGKQELCNTTDEAICTNADKKSNAVQNNKSTLTPEAPETESEAVLCTRNAVYERSTDNHQARELSFGILSYLKENSQTENQKSRLLDSDNRVGNGLHQTEKILLNPSGLRIDKPLFKQTHVDAEEENYEDNSRNKTRNGTLWNPDVPATDAQNVPTVYCDNASGDDATKERSDNMSLLCTFNLCLPKIERGINVDDMSSKQPEQDRTEQAGNATNTCTLNTEAISLVKADGLEIIAHKKTPADTTISSDKLIPLKKVNDDIQRCSIKNGHSLEINNSANNTLLKEKKLSLTGTVPGRKFAEGHLKESCSLPMRTSGNLVNISGRSSFDLSTSDKKAEKTPVYVNFLDLGSCSRVNQTRGQAAWTSASTEPSLSKEKLPGLVENTNTKLQLLPFPFCQSGSTSFNRAADTLNTSSIHRAPKGDPGEDWNAIAKTFYDSSFPTEHVSQLKILRTRPQ
uniref:Coiled-coil domain containing 73 n=1 Tax=Strigops habroptila TaxID=2489341 RepID=A0A672UEP8_STRHB